MAHGYAERVSSGTVARVVFVLFVLATIGAFFVIQRLKRSDPVIRHVHMPAYVSPNGDGFKETARISFRLVKGDRVTVSITDVNGDEVQRLADRRLSRGLHTFFWNGRDSSGRVAHDGFYFLRVILRGQGRGTVTREGVHLVTKPPEAKLLSVAPARVAPRAQSAVTIRFSGPARPPAVFSVYRTDAGPPRLVDRFPGAPGAREGVWFERIAGRRAPPGTYAFGVTVRNRAYVAGSSPPRLPPTAASAAPKTGLTIAGLEAAPPLEPVRAGFVAPVTLTGASGRVTWTATALGSQRPVRRGAGRAPVVRVSVPSRARTGLYTVRLRGRGGAAAVPIAVRGRGPGRVLVVLPAMTWQGLNRVDGDADGFPDTLETARAVPLARPFSSAHAPAGLDTDVAPLLRFLDANRLGYELTTDLALARGHGPGLDRRPGIVFAGSERWFTEALDAKLRAYVEAGGRVASFGTDAFRRTVSLTPTLLADPSPPQGTNALGEQTGPAASEAAPLVVNSDRLSLFAGTDGFVGLFERFEQSQSRVAGARVVAAAGRDPRRPAFVAYRLGNGLVVRTGTPQWARALESDTEVARVTRNLWSLLSR
jgi:N,N-dimethylformamidase beta subunit-like protein/flagellar hook capping protein FlgD